MKRVTSLDSPSERRGFAIGRATPGLAIAVLALLTSYLVGKSPLLGLAVCLVPFLVLWLVLGAAGRGVDLCVIAAALLLASNFTAPSGSFANVLRWPVLAAAVIAVALWPKRDALPLRGLGLWVALLLGSFSLLSLTWSSFPLLTLGRGAAFALCLLVSFQIGSDVRRKGRFDLGLAAVFCGIGFFCAIAVVLSGPHLGTFSGPFGNKNSLGVTGAIGVPFLIAFGLRPRHSRWRLLILSGALCLGLGTLLSGSRGGAIGLTCGCAALLWRRIRQPDRSESRRRKPGVRVLTVLLFIVVPASTLFGVFAARSEGLDLSDRRIQWGSLQRVTEGRALLGTGFGTSQNEFLRFQVQIGYPETERVGANYHNSFLTLISDLGILGSVALAGVLVSITLSRHAADELALVVLVAGLATAIVESWLFAGGSGWALIFWANYARAVLEPKVSQGRRRIARRSSKPIEPVEIGRSVMSP